MADLPPEYQKCGPNGLSLPKEKSYTRVQIHSSGILVLGPSKMSKCFQNHQNSTLTHLILIG